MLEFIKRFIINDIEYELFKYSFQTKELYFVRIDSKFFTATYEKKFETKEKALEYILNKYSTNKHPY